MRVLLPLTLAVMGATIRIVFTAAWSELLFALMPIDDESRKTFVVGLLTFIGRFDVAWGQMMAASMLGLTPACLFFAVAALPLGWSDCGHR
jgi:multiple sugar transport system permease protein